MASPEGTQRLQHRNARGELSRSSQTQHPHKVHFPLELQVRYRTLDSPFFAGEGCALNISSNGAVVRSQQALQLGTKLELYIEWPLLLERQVPLQLVTIGHVVACGQNNFRVFFLQHQFRTTTRDAKPLTPAVTAGSVERGPG